MAACLNDTARSGDQDELPDMRLPEELLLRRHDVDQRECLGHARPNLTSLDVADQIREDGFVPRRAADEADVAQVEGADIKIDDCLLYTSPSPRDATLSRMPSSA